ncbi:MAG: PP2C family protein-serine/threonine phosphatase [Blautia sp.]|nr:PP2C family protein-serine/threonine phosphatase [Blautia sp.]
MNQQKMKQGLNRRITLVLLSMMILMAAILAVASYYAFRNTYLRFYDEKAQQMVRILVDRTDWERIAHYAETGEKDAYVEDLLDFYDHMKISAYSPLYLYIFVPGETSFTYLYEARTPEDDLDYISNWGDVYEYTEFEYERILPDIEAKKAHDEITLQKNDYYGAGLSTWAPVLDDEGNVRAMVELDYLLPYFQSDLNTFVFRIIIIFILCVVVVLVLLLFYLEKNVIVPIGLLNKSIKSYQHGNLRMDQSLFAKDDEINHLSRSFGSMVKRIEDYTEEIARVTAEKERIGAELDVAKRIQADMLPSTFPAFPNRKDCDIYASMTPAKEVGGDFYDFFLADNNTLAMVIADVSGKGIPAALFMVIAKTLIKNRALLGGGPSEILCDVNDQICEGNDENLFVTVWLVILDLKTGKGLAANAGHEHPALCRKGQQYELIEYKHAPALGVMPGLKFREHEFQLYPGDKIFVYTDGVTEANNADKELFGTDRTIEALNADPSSSLRDTLRRVRKAIDEFAHGEPQFDDITMMGFEYKGPADSDKAV